LLSRCCPQGGVVGEAVVEQVEQRLRTLLRRWQRLGSNLIALLLASVPDGFALDATHQPHLTTVQRYVRTSELDKVYAAVEQTLAHTATSALSYRALAVRHADWGVPGQGLAALVLRPAHRCSTSKPRCSPL